MACVAVGIQGIFFSEYNVEGFEGKEHVFSGVQRSANEFIDRTLFGIEANTTTQQLQSTNTATSSSSSSAEKK